MSENTQPEPEVTVENKQYADFDPSSMVEDFMKELGIDKEEHEYDEDRKVDFDDVDPISFFGFADVMWKLEIEPKLADLQADHEGMPTSKEELRMVVMRRMLEHQALHTDHDELEHYAMFEEDMSPVYHTARVWDGIVGSAFSHIQKHMMLEQMKAMFGQLS